MVWRYAGGNLYHSIAGISAARDTINPLLGQPWRRNALERVHEIVLSRKEIGDDDLVSPQLRPGRTISLPACGRSRWMEVWWSFREVIDEVEHQDFR